MSLLVLAGLEAVGCAGLLFVRRRIAGEAIDRTLVAVIAATVAALMIGSTMQVSGLALALPVTAGMVIVLLRSRWRLGDLALLALVAAAGSALGYQLEATLDPATGSFGDQGAQALAVVAVPLGIAAVISARRRTRTQMPR